MTTKQYPNNPLELNLTIGYYCLMNKYKAFFRNYLATALEYRFNQLSYVFLSLVGFGGTVIFWLAVFREQSNVGGFTLEKAVGYYFLVIPVGFLTSVIVSDSLAPAIRLGDFSNHLLKPYKIWVVSLVDAVTRQIFWASLVLPFFAIVWLIFFSTKLPVKIEGLLPGLCFTVLGFLLHFFLDLFVSFLAFWFDDVWSFSHLKRILFMVLGGQMFPFDLISPQFRNIVEVLPFKYFYYLPAAYIQGQRTISYLLSDVGGVIMWTMVFAIASSLVYRKGIKSYGAYGR